MSNQWYPFFPGDYARDTVHLSLMEDCYYRRLLDYYYSTGGPLPVDLERLQRVCRAFSPEERAAVQFLLSEFFEEGEDGFHNFKADEVMAKAKVVSEKRSAAASTRWKKGEKGRSKTDANEMQLHGDEMQLHEKEMQNGCIHNHNHKSLKPPPLVKGVLPRTEQMLRDMVEEKRDFIRTNYGLDDREINIQLEEMVVKTRDRSPGPDLWLYISRFLNNRKDDINGKQQRIAGGAAASPGKEGGRGQQAVSGGRGLDAGQVRGGKAPGPSAAFEDRSDEWASVQV